MVEIILRCKTSHMNVDDYSFPEKLKLLCLWTGTGKFYLLKRGLQN
jgi:hypothetical protein